MGFLGLGGSRPEKLAFGLGNRDGRVTEKDRETERLRDREIERQREERHGEIERYWWP